MNVQDIYFFTFFNLGFSEWILLPLVCKENDVKKYPPIVIKNEFCPQKLTNVSNEKVEICPDFHNLTSTSYAKTQKKRNQSQYGWEISLEDVNYLIRQNQQVPKAMEAKTEFVKILREKLEVEAERRLRNLFSYGVREARTKYINFPSMESSLMTISMLLFGVYLTKIILKLLQTQYRYNMGMMMGGIRAPLSTNKGRRGKSTSPDLKKLNLMRLIDKYDSQFN